jgi:COMPASS component SWD3
MKESSELPGHSNRIFCVKFNPYDPNKIASGGWDNTI